MTESEARSKWCPMVRVAIPMGMIGVSVNKDVEDWRPLQGSKCVASDCMMWRWDGDKPLFQFEKYRANKEATVEPVPRPLNIPASWEWIPYNPENDDYDAGWLESTEEADKRRKGYCGLAGEVNA